MYLITPDRRFSSSSWHDRAAFARAIKMRPQLLPLAHAAAACLTPVHGWSPAAVPTRALPCAAPRAAVRLCDAGDAEMDGGSSNWLEGEEQEMT